MNDPEVTMSKAVSNTNLVAYTKALEAEASPSSLSLQCRLL